MDPPTGHVQETTKELGFKKKISSMQRSTATVKHNDVFTPNYSEDIIKKELFPFSILPSAQVYLFLQATSSYT